MGNSQMYSVQICLLLVAGYAPTANAETVRWLDTSQTLSQIAAADKDHFYVVEDSAFSPQRISEDGWNTPVEDETAKIPDPGRPLTPDEALIYIASGGRAVVSRDSGTSGIALIRADLARSVAWGLNRRLRLSAKLTFKEAQTILVEQCALDLPYSGRMLETVPATTVVWYKSGRSVTGRDLLFSTLCHSRPNLYFANQFQSFSSVAERDARHAQHWLLGWSFTTYRKP